MTAAMYWLLWCVNVNAKFCAWRLIKYIDGMLVIRTS